MIQTKMSDLMITELLGNFPFKERIQLLDRIPHLRDLERSVPMKFQNVSFKFSKKHETSSFHLDGIVWKATKKNNEELSILCPNGRTETLKETDLKKAFDGLIDHYLARRGTEIKNIHFQKFFPSLPKQVTATQALFVNQNRAEKYEPGFLTFFRTAAQQVEAIMFSLLKTSTPRLLEELKGCKIQAIAVNYNIIIEPQTFFDINMESLTANDGSSPTKSRFLRFIEFFRYKPDRNHVLTYTMHLSRSQFLMGLQTFNDADFEAMITAMNARLLKADRLYVIDLPDGLELVIHRRIWQLEVFMAERGHAEGLLDSYRHHLL